MDMGISLTHNHLMTEWIKQLSRYRGNFLLVHTGGLEEVHIMVKTLIYQTYIINFILHIIREHLEQIYRLKIYILHVQIVVDTVEIKVNLVYLI